MRREELRNAPDRKVHDAYMGPTWGRVDPCGSHVGAMILAIRGGAYDESYRWMFYTFFSFQYFIQQEAKLSNNAVRMNEK